MTADDAAVFYSVMMLLHPLFSFENIIGVFIDFQFEGGNHFAFYAHLREHGAGSVLIRTGLKLADAFFICFKEYKIFFSSAVSWDFFAIGDSFRDDCRKGDAHGSAGFSDSRGEKSAQRKRSGTENSEGLLRQIRKYVHPPAFARLDQSNQIYLLWRVSSLFSCSSMFMAVYFDKLC